MIFYAVKTHLQLVDFKEEKAICKKIGNFWPSKNSFDEGILIPLYYSTNSMASLLMQESLHSGLFRYVTFNDNNFASFDDYTILTAWIDLVLTLILSDVDRKDETFISCCHLIPSSHA